MSDESRWGRLAHMVRDLDPGSRALLDLSVRRGLADVEIAGVLGTDPTYVTNTRTGVIRTMAADLQLGDEISELESALAQLPPEAWLPPAAGANGSGAAHAEPDAELEEPEVDEEPEAVVADDEDIEPVDEPEAEEEPEPEEEAEPEAVAEHDEVTAEHEAEPEPDDEDDGDRGGGGIAPEFVSESPRRRNLGAILTAAAIVLLGATLVVIFALSGGSDDDDRADRPAGEQSAEREQPAGDRERGGDRREEPKPEPEPKPEEPALERRELAPLAGFATEADGTVARDGDRVVLRVNGLPRGAYEVWLYDSLIDSKSLGRLRRDGDSLRGRFEAADLRDYRWVDISREPRDGNANHSGRSVMRIATGELR